jgi:hypothetical protein
LFKVLYVAESFFFLLWKGDGDQPQDLGRNFSMWMLLERVRFTLDGLECNKIGVSYEAFNGQPSFCASPFWSCLHNQLWNFREVSQIEVAPSLIILATFSPLISLLLQLYNYCKMNYLLIIYCQLSFSMHHKIYFCLFLSSMMVICWGSIFLANYEYIIMFVHKTNSNPKNIDTIKSPLVPKA